MTKAKRRRRGPDVGIAWSRSANDSGKATSKRALEELPEDGRDSTIGRRVQSVRNVIPRTKMSRTVSGEYIAT
jgi:hypothetical protein